MYQDDKIYVSEEEYGRLCRVDGKMDALIDYINSVKYVDVKVIKSIIGSSLFPSEDD